MDAIAERLSLMYSSITHELDRQKTRSLYQRLMTKHLTGVPPVRTTHASSFKKIGDPEPGSWNRVCVKFQQLIRTLTEKVKKCTTSVLYQEK
jgi:hypothetical protein